MTSGEEARITGKQDAEARPTAAWAVVAVAAGAIACGGPLGTLPRVADVAPLDGYKMLRPQQAATRCVGGVGFAGDGDDRDLLGEALRALLARDAEADLVRDVRVAWSWWSVGVYSRRCVTVIGDVVRSTRTILLPMPASHGPHDAHH